MHVLIGSKNPAKVRAISEAFLAHFPDATFQGLSVSSGVSDQPIGDHETLSGARNRAKSLVKQGGADYYIGNEAGLTQKDGMWLVFGVTVILDNQENEGVGFTAHYPLANSIAQQILAGEEMHKVAIRESGIDKIHEDGGILGYFTNRHYTREKLIDGSVHAALIPFLNPKLYQ